MNPTPAQKTAAARIGMDASEYAARRAAGLKWCSKCRQWLATSDFQRNVARWDGYQQRCTPCKVNDQRSHRAGGAA